MVTTQSWGRLSKNEHDIHFLSGSIESAQKILTSNLTKGVAYGMGRSYGDVCLNAGGVLWNTTRLDHFIKFDQDAGILQCEAGILLRDIQQVATKTGWMLPVTPGTQMITLGGAIANDVHGKNHHRMGSFGEHILSLTLARTDGQIIECSPQSNSGLFWATVGGVGLTGVIISAQVQLRVIDSLYLNTESIPYSDLNDFIQLANISERDWEYTVSWIDCQSKKKTRGIFMRANHSSVPNLEAPITKSRTLSFTPPFSAINPITLPILNSAYFYLNKFKNSKSITHYQPFFYPLDNIQQWNRMYGPRGFYQYQSIIPKESGLQAVGNMLDVIKRSGEGSFLAVLKTFGDRISGGMLSFPRPGVTLAIDFPNHGIVTHKLFSQLNSIVEESGGRIYLAKDACMPKTLFEAGYPRLSEFFTHRDPGISSELSRRLMGA